MQWLNIDRRNMRVSLSGLDFTPGIMSVLRQTWDSSETFQHGLDFRTSVLHFCDSGDDANNGVVVGRGVRLQRFSPHKPFQFHLADATCLPWHWSHWSESADILWLHFAVLSTLCSILTHHRTPPTPTTYYCLLGLLPPSPSLLIFQPLLIHFCPPITPLSVYLCLVCVKGAPRGMHHQDWADFYAST